MNGAVKALMVVGLLAGALLVTGTAASADSIGDADTLAYQDAMWYFVPELGKWSKELQLAVAAAELKPEVALELPELAYRGEFMVHDLEGTQAPYKLAAAHEQLEASVSRMSEAARYASDDPAGALSIIEAELDAFNGARREIRAWLLASMKLGEPGSAPVLSAVGR